MKQFSLTKITEMLSNYGYIIYRIFGRDNMCEYIEVVSMNWTDFFCIYVDEYDIPCGNVLELEKIQEEEIQPSRPSQNIEDDRIIQDSIVENTEEEMEMINENYTDISIRDVDLTNPNAERELEKSYSTTIDVKDSKELNYKNVAEHIRQLKRLNRCVEDIDYNLAIYTKRYFIVSSGNRVKAYYIKKADYSESSRILIVTTFENMVYNVETIYDNILFIKNGLYRTFKKTQSNFIKALSPLFNINEFIYDSLSNIHILEENVSKFTNFLEIAKRKSEVLKEVKETNEYEESKSDIVQTILNNRIKYETLLLKLDKVLFENAVMMTRILKNFNKLNEII